MKLRLLAIAIAISAYLMIAASPLQAQYDDYYTSKLRFGVGAQAGLMSGMGLGVRVHPAGRMSVQLAGGAFSGGDAVTGSVGIEGQFDFDWRERSRFYGFVGMGYYTNGEEELTEAAGTWAPGKEDPRLKSPFRAGVGLGYEWDISNVLIFSASVAFTYFSQGQFLPLPQFGLYYMFD
ncbi:MAG: hypothetical protein RBU27_07205 [Bacteroidota bacterium]|jgi:hypothetical protein|nr:hypothetical protein [Bacteroidota bacterium]